MSFRKSTMGPIFVHPENLTVRTAEQPTARSENRKYRTLCKLLALKTRHKASRRQATEVNSAAWHSLYGLFLRSRALDFTGLMNA